MCPCLSLLILLKYYKSSSCRTHPTRIVPPSISTSPLISADELSPYGRQPWRLDLRRACHRSTVDLRRFGTLLPPSSAEHGGPPRPPAPDPSHRSRDPRPDEPPPLPSSPPPSAATVRHRRPTTVHLRQAPAPRPPPVV
ncbi:uncharacterized protein M6B38_352015 [Iris pallida]|uniref:Uncharacterized protein n=1 Tax=Iris pallida TaxID=29817 RepID=A0AAX6GPT6_IRIPA|nr:uncharacterized protein M6B38_352015 [Iris pallida]